jgi:hypothetical protein
MKNKILWAVACLGGLACVILGVAQLSAQRPVPQPGQPVIVPFAQTGRFVVARVHGDDVILLDTATGDLYKATPADYKKYSDRPRVGTGRLPFGRDGAKDRKEAPRREEKKDKDPSLREGSTEKEKRPAREPVPDKEGREKPQPKDE